MSLFNQKNTPNNKFESELGSSMIRIDILDEPNAYVVYADAPGLSIEQIKLSMNPDGLLILYQPSVDDAMYFTVEERLHDDAERLIAFEEPIDEKTISANLVRGVLIINIPKKKYTDENIIPIKEADSI